MKRFLLIILLTAFSFNVNADSILLKPEKTAHIIVNNRILAQVNGKAISVMDLMKKMDILFYREFPQYTGFPEAQFQFYQANWKPMLQELIDKELVLADAEENKLPMSAGDIRQEMERIFGPNIIENLDKIGMTFDEAWTIVQGDLIIQRMLYVRVNSKALRNVTPQHVRTLYEGYAQENVKPSEWVYQLISVRDKDPTNGAETANQIYQLLTHDSVPLADIQTKIKELPTLAKTSQITISEEYRQNEKEISPAYKEILMKISAGTYSTPTIQKSRSDNSTVVRLFFLKEMIPGGAPPYNEVAAKLKDMLIGKAVVDETKAYIQKLRKHFDVQESAPEGFQPFVLQ